MSSIVGKKTCQADDDKTKVSECIRMPPLRIALNDICCKMRL